MDRADPDPNFHVDADPDPDPDPDWHQNYVDPHADPIPTPGFTHVGKSEYFSLFIVTVLQLTLCYRLISVKCAVIFSIFDSILKLSLKKIEVRQLFSCLT